MFHRAICVLLLSLFHLGNLTLNITSSINRISDDVLGELIFNRHVETGIFRILHSTSFLKCAVECMLRRHCACVSYSRRLQRCELHGHCSREEMSVSSGVVYSNVETWVKVRWNCNLNYLEGYPRIISIIQRCIPDTCCRSLQVINGCCARGRSCSSFRSFCIFKGYHIICLYLTYCIVT